MKRKIIGILVCTLFVANTSNSLIDVGRCFISEKQISMDGERWTSILFLNDPPLGEWNKTFGGSKDDIGYSIQQTSDGGYIIVGTTESFGSGEVNVWLIKTDSVGNELWNKTFGGNSVGSTEITATTNARIIYTINSRESTALMPGSYAVQQTYDNGYIIVGTTESFSPGQNDVWLIKTDSKGNKEWDNVFAGTYSTWGRSVQQTIDDGYIILGTIKRSYGCDAWLIKTDAKGNILWNKTYGGYYYDHGYEVQQTYDNGYIIVGTTESFSPGQNDVWLIKTDSKGNKEWDNVFAGTYSTWGRSVQQTIDDGYIIAGIYGCDAWLIKTDSEGNELWNKTFGGNGIELAYAVQQTFDYGYVIAGETETGDAWLIKTDAKGNKLWDKTLKGYKTGFGRSIQQTMDGGYSITGYKVTKGNHDVWLGKIVEFENRRPNKVNIEGVTNGKAGNSYSYTFTSTDPDEDEISYYIMWGDGNTTPWTTFKTSGTPYSESHIWSAQDTYTIEVKAKDTYGAESGWATLSVSMPKNKAYINTPFLNFLENHPHLFPLLRQIFELR